MSKKRRSPIKHNVREHERKGGATVKKHVRGSRTARARRQVTIKRRSPIMQIDSATQNVIDRAWWEDYEKKEARKVKRKGFTKWLKGINKHKGEDTSAVVHLRNPEQAIIWQMEYVGQVSDGIWENDRRFIARKYQRHGAWIHYSDAKIFVDPNNVGFSPAGQIPLPSPRRLARKYPGLTGRTLQYVRNTVNPNYTLKELKKDLADMSTILKTRM